MSEQCCVHVIPRGGFRARRCSKAVKCVVDGKHYCATHDPAAINARQEQRSAALMAQMEDARLRAVAKKSTEQDARRYRWLRHVENVFAGRMVEANHGAKLDAEIDRAMAIDAEWQGRVARAGDDPRYTLTEAGYRAVMKQGAKLNGEVKAGEGTNGDE